MESELDSIQIRSEDSGDYGYVAEYSRTLGAHTAVSTDSDDELPPTLPGAARAAADAGIPILDAAIGNLRRDIGGPRSGTLNREYLSTHD